VADIAFARPPADSFNARFQLGCFALCVANLVYAAAALTNGTLILDELGRGMPVDFVNVWVAGRLVLEGNAAAAYDWAIHKNVEDAALGYNFAGYFGWHYPPPFLAVAALLALLPYSAAYAVWVAATLPLYLTTIRALVGQRIGLLLAGAFPAVLSNVMVGQNGFLTAALIGGTVGWLERRPVLAGICLGLLTYKPHFGLLFPLVLIVGGHWTVFFTAAAVGSALALASWLAFGAAAWEAFFHWLPVASNAFLSNGEADFSKLQSVFGLARTLGSAESLGWALQITTTILIAVFVYWLWRRRAPFEMKAAALAAATLLATPYIYLYDMVVLAVPVAMLTRAALATRWRAEEVYGLGAAALLLFSFPFVKAPVGLAATLIVLALVVARALRPETESVVGLGAAM
jgi:arabinofuranan 3-O-arabinosyltransferase